MSQDIQMLLGIIQSIRHIDWAHFAAATHKFVLLLTNPKAKGILMTYQRFRRMDRQEVMCLMHMKKWRRMRRKYTTRIVYSFTATYIAMALIPILIGVIFYTYTLRVVFDNEYEKTSAMLSQSVEAMDSDFRMIRDMMGRLLQSDSLTSLLSSESPYEAPDVVIDSLDFQNELKQVYIGDSLVYDVLIYLPTPNMLYGVKNGYCFTRPDIYYPYFLELEDFSVEQWNSVLSSNKNSYFIAARPAVLEGYEGGVATSSQLGMFVWPLYKDGMARGSVIFLLDATKFISDMELATDIDQGAVAWAQTQDGEVIMNCPVDLDVSSVDFANSLLVSLSSRYNQLEYNVLIPKSIISAKVQWLLNAIVLMVALSVVLGVMAAVIFARRLGLPLDQISRNLRQLYVSESTALANSHDVQRINPLAQLGDNVNELIVKHSQLKRYVSRQINVVDQLFFEKLLGGYFGDENQILAMLEHISQPRLSGPFILAFVRMQRIGSELTVSEASEMSACRTEVFASELSAEYDIFETSLDSCVLIFSLSSAKVDAIERQLQCSLERIARELSRTLDMDVKAALSLPVKRYLELSQAYARCSELIHSSAASAEQTLVYQRDMPSQAYSYSMDVENQLINFTVSGNRERVHELVLNVFGMERMRNGGHMSRSQRLLIQGMFATLMRIGQMLGPGQCAGLDELDAKAQQLIMSGNAAAALDAILAYFDSVIDAVQNRQRGRTDALIAQVRAYVDEHYADCELTLTSVATHFSLTDSYLSRAYKDCTGVNFSAYVERVRIEHALQLIDEPISLDEIATRTGFDHVYNLRSAFKRSLGVTPSEYRKRVR